MDNGLEKINLGYSTKNIPLPGKKDYLTCLTNKAEKFLKNIRWRTFFFLNPDASSRRKETYGFPTTKPPPQVPELKEFEDGMLNIIQNVEFRNVNKPFQKQLSKDIKNIKEDEHLFVPADKTTNFYKVKPEQYNKLLGNNITKDYRKAPVSAEKRYTKVDKNIATKLELENRIDTTAKNEAFITLKDHKPNFNNNPKCRLINPSKPEIGKISKRILERINAKIISATNLNQWKNTDEVISWYTNIKDKQSHSFIGFDVCEFYPSITEDLLSNALKFAATYDHITDDETQIIFQTKKSLLYNTQTPWCKKSNSKFDVTMGSFDGAETCELVGLYLLSQLQHIDINVGLYRDDGLAIYASSRRKETYGFPTTKPPPQVPELKEFEDGMLNIIQNVEFRNVNKPFQKQLSKDIKNIKEDEHLFVPADKTTNFYKVKPEQYNKLLGNNITKDYRKAPVSAEKRYTKVDKNIATKLELENRIDTTAKNEAFITLKDHKPNFNNNPKCRLINPSKPEIGKISKRILERINAKIISATNLNQWKNTDEVISWYTNIKDKQSHSFIGFDVCEFYPSITEDLLSNALKFAATYDHITDDETQIIFQTKKSLLYNTQTPWCKKSNSKFDVTMGSFDGAETCELVGLYLLSQLQHIDINVGLYRDDGLAICTIVVEVGIAKNMIVANEDSKICRTCQVCLPDLVRTFCRISFVVHPDTVKAILSTAEPKDESLYSLLRPMIGDGLLLSKGKKWVRNRRLLTPAFHFEVLRPFTTIFRESAETLVSKWNVKCNGGERSIEMFSDISLLTLDGLLKCIFSIETDCQNLSSSHPYLQGVQDISDAIGQRVGFLPFYIDFIFELSPTGRKHRKALNKAHDFTQSVIKKRSQEVKVELNRNNKKLTDFLDILLSARDADGGGLSTREIENEVDTFMFGGHDTTASGLSWMMVNMALHPEYQSKCRKEVDDLMEIKTEKLEWDDLAKLPYLTMCVKESLRLRGPVPSIRRLTTRPLKFPDGRLVPEGTVISVVIDALHHNPHVWSDPMTYDPERFSPENVKNIPPFAFIPFSAGPRNCIGQNFALNETKMVTAIILRNFYLSLDESPPPAYNLVLRSPKGIHVTVKPRINMDVTFVLLIISLMLFTIAVAKIAGFIYKRRQIEKALNQFPCYDRHWLLGHLKLSGDRSQIPSLIQGYAERAKYAFQFWLGPFAGSLLVVHPDTVKAILSTAEPKDEANYSLLRPWIGDGLLLSKGKKWARNRRLLTPAFHFEVLRPFTTIFRESAETLVSKWNGKCNGGERSIEMFADVSLLTLDGLLKCIFSIETDCQNLSSSHPYLQGVQDISDAIGQRVGFLPFYIDFIFELSPTGRKHRKAVNMAHDFTQSVIKKRSQEVKVGLTRSNKKMTDFLDILLSARDEDGSGLSNQEIQDEVDTFMFEGHDTTASGLSWMMVNMALHPEYQSKCRKEVDELMEIKSEKLEWDDLAKLPYLTMCVKESMRLRGPVPSIRRVTTRPLKFPDGRLVPEGTGISIVIDALHHNPHVWSDPMTYDPERFSPENIKNITPFAFVPFSAGPRNCIGQNFALNETKMVTAIILRNFYLSLDESPPPTYNLVLRSPKGIHVTVKPRNI
ncbi:uncharacterized protein [Amphiura filiformis]|uniref:uncharacterized protein n=1 Tax=Amphiura filiformis TaxID=82378 RepID=UPI003B21D2FE